jgi:hypothetical protein
MPSIPVLIISQHTSTIDYLTDLLEKFGYQTISSAVCCFDLLERKKVKFILFPILEQRIHFIGLLQKISKIYQIPCLLLTTTVSPLLLEQIKQLPAPIYCVKMGNKDSLYIYLELAKYQNYLATQQKNAI